MPNFAATLPPRPRPYKRVSRRSPNPRPHDAVPELRERRIRVAEDLIVRGHTAAAVAKLHSVSRRTVHLWTKAVLAYDPNKVPEVLGIHRVYDAIKKPSKNGKTAWREIE